MATATRNGHAEAPTDDAFPVDSFRDAAPHLRRPFTPAAVKFKVQATWPKKENPTGGLIVSYIDARLVVERLNLVVPHLWHDAYEPVPKGMVCHLTVDGITRRDVGTEQGNVKGLYSDALKRAAVKFGIGISLYATPKMMLNAGDHLKPKRTRDGASLELTPNGDTHVRRLYEAWLDVHGRRSFGEPLDHGDTEGAQGDIDTDVPERGPESPAPQPPSVQLATASDIDELRACAHGLTVRQVRLALGSVGVSVGENVSFEPVPATVVPNLAEMLTGMDRQTAEASA